VVDRVSRRNVAGELPFMATENLLMAAVQAGGDRQALHERIRMHAMAAAERLQETKCDGFRSHLGNLGLRFAS
jgi:adenylosuccinate lyase